MYSALLLVCWRDRQQVKSFYGFKVLLRSPISSLADEKTEREGEKKKKERKAEGKYGDT